ncbi:MAG TPA: hypothetical protein VNE71_14890 [Myxococcota bacterium]|nr:hypothetical protein [Myxococcota bacterium]
MARTILAFAAALLLTGLASAPARANDTLFTADLLGNVANQVIAGFPSSTATWSIEKGRVTLAGFGKGRAILVAKARGLIIPALGFNPSPDFLARLVCHDAAGKPFEGARTKTAPLDPEGDGTLVDVVKLPDACFAPIVLITGSVDPAGNRPGNWFAVSAL